MSLEQSASVPGLNRIDKVSWMSGLAATAGSAALALGTCITYILLGLSSPRPACVQYLIYSSLTVGVIGVGMAETYDQLPGTSTLTKLVPVLLVAFLAFYSGELLPAVAQMMSDLSLGIPIRVAYFSLASVVSIGAATLVYKRCS